MILSFLKTLQPHLINHHWDYVVDVAKIIIDVPNNKRNLDKNKPYMMTLYNSIKSHI